MSLYIESIELKELKNNNLKDDTNQSTLGIDGFAAGMNDADMFIGSTLSGDLSDTTHNGNHSITNFEKRYGITMTKEVKKD